nr:alpha/beta fold hydrolase [Luteibacter sp. Sphag1AF]
MVGPLSVAATETQPLPRPVPSVPATTITWGECSSSLVAAPETLKSRVQCGQLDVPLDHHNPDGRTLTVALVRIAAGNPAERRGSIFFNPGGPGSSPMSVLPLYAWLWSNITPGDPIHGLTREVGEKYDLIGVVPRGLNGGTTYSCQSPEADVAFNDVIADRSPANIAAVDLAVRRYVAACKDHPFRPYITTEQNVFDLDLVRRSLGEAKLNYFGISYGTWMGIWYASLYPASTGRMLLDSSMDWTGTMETNLLASAPEQQARFNRTVADPMAAASTRYGMGNTRDAIIARIRALSPRVREAWASDYRYPESVLAAVAASEWLTTNPDLGSDDMKSIASSYVFSTDPQVNERAQAEARRMVSSYFLPNNAANRISLTPAYSVLLSTTCNDSPTVRDTTWWQNTIADYSHRYPAAVGDHLFYHCALWGGPQTVQPTLQALVNVPDILMIHSEYDVVTPLTSAMRSFEATPSAHMIVARGADEHGFFGHTETACIERVVASFLLDGIKPADRLTNCQIALPSPGSSPLPSGYSDPLLAKTLREYLLRSRGFNGWRPGFRQ